MQRHDLEKLSREELIAHAERLGIPRPRVLTAPELCDEIISRTQPNPARRVKERGWLGKARDLLARVVEQGLHLPEAARAIRTQASMNKDWPNPPPPLPTVTLAEIYAAQGHLERAISVLDEVIARNPDHKEAKALRERLSEQSQRAKPKPSRVTDAVETPPEAEAPEAPEKESAAADPPGEPEAQGAEASEDQAAPETPTETPAQPAAEAREAPAAQSPEASLEAQAGEAMAFEEPPAEEANTTEITANTTEIEAAPSIETNTKNTKNTIEEPAGVDEVVAIAVDPHTVYVYWEVRPETLAKAKARNENGILILRSVSVVPSWDGPVHATRDVPVDELFGDGFLRDMPPGADIRITIGFLANGQFEPFAIGQELALPRLEPSPAVAGKSGTFGATLPSHSSHGERVERGPVAALASLGRFAAHGPAEAGAGAFSRAGGIEAPPKDLGGAHGPGAPETGGMKAVVTAVSVAAGSGPEGARGRLRYYSYIRKQGESVVYGGASELLWGGASELVRGGASELLRRG